MTGTEIGRGVRRRGRRGRRKKGGSTKSRMHWQHRPPSYFHFLPFPRLLLFLRFFLFPSRSPSGSFSLSFSLLLFLLHRTTFPFKSLTEVFDQAHPEFKDPPLIPRRTIRRGIRNRLFVGLSSSFVLPIRGLPTLCGINSCVSIRIAGSITERTTSYKENEENETTAAGQKKEEREEEE